jgi:hypothetical protein
VKRVPNEEVQRIAEVAKRTKAPFTPDMGNVAEIEAAIEKLSPQEQRELAAWYEQRQALLNAAGAVFQVYEDEEKAP